MRKSRGSRIVVLAVGALLLSLLGPLAAAADDTAAPAAARTAGGPPVTPREASTTDIPGPTTSTVSPLPVGWWNLMAETFEGVWPNGLWTAYDANGATQGEYFWDDDARLAHGGSWGAWAANGGANGLDPASNNYPASMDSWMVYGPFDLSNPAYTSANMEFFYWNESELGFDFFSWLASGDGIDWTQLGRVSGISGGGSAGAWQYVDAGLSDYLGDSSVWFAFRFTSDGTNFDDGPFVDDVDLWAYDSTPRNDDFDLAPSVTASSVTFTQETTYATTAGDDPLFPCAVGSQRYRTVWYAFTPTVPQRVGVDTFGSDYDTVLGVWTGSRGSLSNVACNDDAASLQSAVEFFAEPGVTYYIEAAGFWDAGGSLTLNFKAANLVEATIYGDGAYDGWVLEQGEDLEKGSTALDPDSTLLVLGDDSMDRQYRAILDFNTSGLPDGAVVTEVTLRVKYQGRTGTNPILTHGLLKVDMRTGFFHDIQALEKYDFQAPGSRGNVGRFIKVRDGDWYRAPLRAPSYGRINLTGITQFRLRFDLGDNDDGGADLLQLVSGNVGSAADRPQLIVEYYVP